MLLAAVSQFSVDLIGKDVKIVLLHDLCNGLQVFFFHDRPGRVIGEGKHQDLGIRCYRLLQFFCRKAEAVLFLQVDDHRLPACQDRAGLIGNIRGLRDQYLIPRIDQRPEHQVNGLGAADRNEDLMVIVIIDSLGAFHIGGDLHLQLFEAGVGGIERPSLLQGINAFIPDMPGRVEVRFTDAQGNGVLHFRNDIEEFPDAGGLEAHRLLG